MLRVCAEGEEEDDEVFRTKTLVEGENENREGIFIKVAAVACIHVHICFP
jgi:hypothetical protein